MVPVCAAVIIRSGMIFLARRGPGRKHAGQWEFPGGRIEDGETSAAALARELREELGISAEIGEEFTRVRHAYDSGEIELIAHWVRGFSGEIRLSDHDQSKWVESSKLLEYDLVPADIPIAKLLTQHRRRGRYKGKNPRRFEEKYKELSPERFPEEVVKAKARGSTPAGAHLPVMIGEVLSALEPLAGAVILDCTLGWGGHAQELARRAGPKGSVIGIDRDGEELARTEKRLLAEGIRIAVRQSNYADAAKILAELKIDGVDALLADLGVSSMQLDRPERGMSFKTDEPLDMRMDRSQGKTASEWLESASEKQIAETLSGFGNEPDAWAIAATLSALKVQGRSPKTTGELASAVGIAKDLGPGRFKKKDAFAPHPATRTFQALRIAVNSEYEALEKLLADLPKLVRPKGRAAILTFHSGEEALVRGALCAQAAAGLWQPLSPQPRKPSPEEVRENPRARSARLWNVVRTDTAVLETKP
ncbi:MAG: 16S rRNA (cytosine(1402)-N(4))-methyltransferase RsmH [Elusimicrobiota bacterium]|jgi:16S rRNA (cytosine1402-N4)-methyltransferase